MGKRTGRPKGRPSGAPNKRTIGVDLQLARGGLSAKEPASAIDQLEKIASIFWNKAVALQNEKKGERADHYFELSQKAWAQLAPYRHARLSSVKVEGTMGMDLSRLPAGDLAYMRKLVDKLGGD